MEMAALDPVEDFAHFGIRAFTTTRLAGTLGTNGTEPVSEVMDRWRALQRDVARAGPRFATAAQVHGNRVVVHGTHWEGWLRVPDADGHVAVGRGTGLGVTIADCVPVFLAHPGGAVALLHSGWRGTVARIIEHAIAALEHRGHPAHELRMHLGPAICGTCYEVSPEVYAQLTGTSVAVPTTVDLRAIIEEHARHAGVRHVTTSQWCTRCHNDRFFSHRAGDTGRQVAVIIAEQ